MRWRKAAILGVGLLGGSLGLALRRRGLVQEVWGLVRRPETAAEAVALGALDAADTDLPRVVEGADLVVLCTPLGQMAELASRLVGVLPPGALVTDVGSTKVSVLDAVEGPVAAAGGHFVGSHPMAGSERNGVSASREDLFHGAVTVITPTLRTHPAALEATRQLWTSVGSRLLEMSAAEHDRCVARSSHLPHLVAAALVRTVLAPGRPADLEQLCATGFRDTTRVASGSPEMWRDIGLANREALLAAIEGFERSLTELRGWLASGDATAMEAALKTAKEQRDRWLAASPCRPPEPAP